MLSRLIVNIVLGICCWIPVLCLAESRQTYNLVIKDHQFSPSQLSVAANQKIILNVDNQDPTAEEFESYELYREKIVNGHKKIIVFLGPLATGTYKYFGDFHQSTAQGIIIAQ